MGLWVPLIVWVPLQVYCLSRYGESWNTVSSGSWSGSGSGNKKTGLYVSEEVDEKGSPRRAINQDETSSQSKVEFPDTTLRDLQQGNAIDREDAPPEDNSVRPNISAVMQNQTGSLRDYRQAK